MVFIGQSLVVFVIYHVILSDSQRKVTAESSSDCAGALVAALRSPVKARGLGSRAGYEMFLLPRQDTTCG